MEVIKRNLVANRQVLLELLIQGEYNEVCSKLSKICLPYCLPKSKDDFTKFTPYKRGTLISEYLNYSEISYGNKKYVAASKPKNIKAFRELMRSCDVVISCIKDINYVDYPINSTPKYLNNNIIFYDEIYNEGRVLRFENWVDHDVMKSEEFEFFYDYYKACKFNRPLIHCLAGVGRTGVLILYDILNGRNYSQEEFLDILIDIRAQRNGMVYSEKQLKFLVEKFIK